MNCKEAQLQTLQLAEARPSAELIAHARTCKGCRRVLEEMLQHQVWLRRQFAEVSARLLAEAPTVTEVMLRDRLQRLPPPSRARPMAWAAALALSVAVAGATGWYLKTHGKSGPQQAASAVSKKTATNAVARAGEKLRAAAARAGVSKPKAKPKQKPRKTAKGDEFDPDAPGKSLKPQPSPDDAAVVKTPTAAGGAPAPAQAAMTQPPSSEPRSFAFAPTDAIPTAGGNVAVTAQQAADGSPGISVAMNLHGLAAEAAYTIVGADASDQRVVLADVITDANGSATTPLATGTLPGASWSDAMAGTGSPGWLRQLTVLDAAGNTVLTVSQSPKTPAQPVP